MAVMIPEKPRDYDPASQEGLMFEALSSLPDEYYVFHSLRLTTVTDNVFRESETDFVVFNREKGIICLEAKAGQVRYEGGTWLYGNGIPISHGGPFNQASSNKYKLMKYIEFSPLAMILQRCRFYHAVWFPSISDDVLRSMKLPPEADRKIVLTKEALEDPERYLDSIYSMEFTGNTKTMLSENDTDRLIKEILCPQFNVFPAASMDSDLKKMVFHRLLKEQAGILNYLDEQKTAAINGAAGTGKTMIAVEKARRHAAAGDKVLFLCFNSYLKDYLQSNYSDPNIFFFTIAGFVCSICDTSSPDYLKAKDVLDDMYFSGRFPYKHIIIDEGQDFGSDAIEEADILNLLHDIVTDESVDGTFYVFYDKLQLIQAKEMPAFIEDLDCRLTLYRNCRNTENIAFTSLRPISERTPKLYEGAIKGKPAKIHFCSEDGEAIKSIDDAISLLAADGIGDIVILTCATEASSILSPYVKNGKYKGKYLFTTCRKYKGLEADAIIMADVDLSTFTEDILLFYVGASRARLRLEIVTEMSDLDCAEVLRETLGYNKKVSKGRKDLSGVLHTIGVINKSE
ncbi:MAG: NERD domain-containing protein [Oscillospiraceae bacterium]|nr:NERD domain-containing protein [Oscillospiraceae bacterium]